MKNDPIWTLTFSEAALKDLKKMDAVTQRRIIEYMKKRVISLKDPRQLGKPLGHNRSNIWRYRVGDYRILCEIQDSILTVEVVHTGHRKEIYKIH